MAYLSEDDLRTRLRLLQEHKGNHAAAAKIVGVSTPSFRASIQRAERENIRLEESKIEFPQFVVDGEEEPPIDELLAHIRKSYERKERIEQARLWFPIKVREEKPYAILWFGDPHLGNGNFSLLECHLAVARQDGVYGGNIGDTTDNFPWTGKLARLWAETEMSSKTERRLAQWFMFEAGVKWMVWLLGNHDSWNAGDDFYKRLGAHRVPVIDWRGQFRLVHNNGSQTRVDAAHGRKGNSIYNPTHGTLRDAKFGEDADAYITGHIHSFGLFEIEFPERKMKTWLAQISGYKRIDRHALVNGFAAARHGAAVLQIVYPENGKTVFFSDVEEGAEYLKWLRR